MFAQCVVFIHLNVCNFQEDYQSNQGYNSASKLIHLVLKINTICVYKVLLKWMILYCVFILEFFLQVLKLKTMDGLLVDLRKDINSSLLYKYILLYLKNICIFYNIIRIWLT